VSVGALGYAAIVGVGFASSLVSGLTGLAGGVLLLSALALLFPIEVVIPLHASAQVLANLSRVLMLRDFIEWRIWSAFNLLTIPAGLLGAYAVPYLPKELIKASVGAVILLAALYSLKALMAPPSTPKLEASAPEADELAPTLEEPHAQVSSRARYVALGATSSLLGMVVGATGPLIAPFFMIAGLKRERFIATKSACQLTVQLIKTALFAQVLSFSYMSYKEELSLALVGILTGTWVAKRLLSRLSGPWLELLIVALLITLGGRMIIEVL